MAKINDAYDIGAAFQAIEDELIASMIRNMKDHKLEEIDEDKQWSMWQAEQLKALEKYKRQNQKKYSGQFKDINSKIEALIRHSKAEGGMQQELEILEAIKSGFKGAKRASAGGTAEFFRLNERKLEALIKATTADMKRAETAVLRMADDQYRKIIFNAQVYANTGAGTYEKAVDMATKDMLSSGLNCVEYKNGARHTLADYAEMAIRTASKRAYLQGEGEKRQEWGISTVIVNKRGNPCPKCLPFVGKVFIDDVWSGGTKNGKSPVTGLKYPLMSKAISAGLYHPRCKDSHTTYFEGISTPPDNKYTRDELDKIAEDYRKEQKEQHAERQEEKFGRLAENSLDEENQKRYAARREEWKAKRTGTLPANQSEDLTERRRRRLTERKKQQLEACDETITPDFSSMSTAELQKYAAEHLRTTFVGVKGANADYVREAVKVMDKFEKTTGNTIEGLKVQFGGLPKGVYAKYDDSTKTLLLKKTGSIKAFEESQMKANARYRVKWNTEKDYYATETYSGTIWHELGHAVDIDSGQSLSRKLSLNSNIEEASLKVSAYAGSTQGVRVSKRSEAWAENFAAYMDGGRNASKVPDEIKEMIDGYFTKSVAKDAGSGIIETYRKGDTHRKVSEIGNKIIDKATYHKITKPAIRKGADIRIADAEILDRLKKQNATAVTYGDTIFFREDATVSDVLEEVHHFYQNKEGLNSQYGQRQRAILNEIDAKEYLLSMADKYNIPKDESDLTKKQLQSYISEMETLKKDGEWID